MNRRLMLGLTAQVCTRIRIQSDQANRLARLADAEAWIDAALALIELELPMWQVRRIAYDEGEWHCALSRERELPDWLDAAVEARHADLALALLSAFVEVKASASEEARPSVPRVGLARDSLFNPLPCDNFA